MTQNIFILLISPIHELIHTQLVSGTILIVGRDGLKILLKDLSSEVKLRPSLVALLVLNDKLHEGCIFRRDLVVSWSSKRMSIGAE